ncbi:MAG: hypothetical protein ACKPCM_00975 [Pseudanabaena sp.]
MDKNSQGLQESKDRNLTETTQHNSSQEILSNSPDNISSELIQRKSESSLSLTNASTPDNYIENTTESNSNSIVNLENKLENKLKNIEQNTQIQSDIHNLSNSINTSKSNLDPSFAINEVADASSLATDAPIQKQVDLDNSHIDIATPNNLDSDRNLDVQDAIALFGINDHEAGVSELPVKQTSSGQPLQRKIDSSKDFDEVNTKDVQDIDLISSSTLENISVDTEDTSNLQMQREHDISNDTSINKLDNTENIQETSNYPSINSSQNLLQTSDSLLINKKTDDNNQSSESQNIQQVPTTENVINNEFQSNSTQLGNSNNQKINESNSHNLSNQLADQTLDNDLSSPSQTLPSNPVEDNNTVQLQRSLQENNIVVDKADNEVVDTINTSPNISQTIQAHLDVTPADSYLQRDLTNSRNVEHDDIVNNPQNIVDTSQSNFLEETSQNNLDNVSSKQIQRNNESSSITPSQVTDPSSILQSSNELSLHSHNLETSDNHIENSTNSSDNTKNNLENLLEKQSVNIQRQSESNTLISTESTNLPTNNNASNLDLDPIIQRQVDIPQIVDINLEGVTQEDLGTFNSSDSNIFDSNPSINPTDTPRTDITSNQNLVQPSNTSHLNRKIDSNSKNILNTTDSHTENILQNSPSIEAKGSQDIQLSNYSETKNSDTSDQTLINDIASDFSPPAIQAKSDTSNPVLELDSNLYGNLDSNHNRDQSTDFSSISNDKLVQKSSNSSNDNFEAPELFTDTNATNTNILDNYSIEPTLSLQDNIQTLSDTSDSSKPRDSSDPKIETRDTSTELSTIQKDEIAANNQTVQREIESAKSESSKNIKNLVQTKAEEAIAPSQYQNNQKNNQTVIQKLSDQENVDDLTLPIVLQNLGQTQPLSSFTPLNSNQYINQFDNQFNNQLNTQSNATKPSILQAKSDSASVSNPWSSSNPISDLSPSSTRIQSKADPNSQVSGIIPQETHAGWSNIAELLANLPPPQVSSNPSTSSLNKKSANASDRSSLTSNPKPSSSQSSQTTSSPTVIQRSLDDNADDSDLYITPTGLQRGNPKQFANSPNIIQRKKMPSVDENLPEATVKVNPREDSDRDANFEENLNALAQEIYVLLRQRLEIEKERQGSRYQGRLPW